MRNNGKYAQYFHITPEQGLLNDPNGLCYFDGYWHVFYQYNPYATDHSTKYWGHVRSKDMVNWEQLPVALKSDDWFDKNGVYSGGAIVHEGVMYLFYTGNTKDENGIRTSYQCVATSTDGIHFEKHGAILEQAPGYTGHVRDPKVWYDAQVNGWWLILGAQKLDKTGDLMTYFSTDLTNWEYKGSSLQFDKPYGYMWECPDMIFLQDEVTHEEKAVFIFSPQGIEPNGMTFNNIFNTAYLVGKWDSQTAQFVPDEHSIEAVVELDRGFEYYAPQTFIAPDGRVIQYAWMGIMWPEVEEAVPTRADNWLHQLSMPKALSLKNGKLYQSVVAEQQALVQSEKQYQWEGSQLQLDVNVPSKVEMSIRSHDVSFNFNIYNEVDVAYNAKSQVLTVYRTNWLTKEHEERAVSIANLTHLTAWIDASSIELIVNEGQEVFSLRYFSQQPIEQVNFYSHKIMSATITVSNLTGYTFESQPKFV